MVAFVQSTNKHSVRPDCALSCACTGPQDGPDVAPSHGAHSPAGEGVEKVVIRQNSAAKYMISSARAVGRVWENSAEKGILKLKSEEVTKHSRVGDGSQKHF